MKIKNLIAAGVMLVAFTFAGTKVSAQTTTPTSTVHQDKKALNNAQDKKAKNVAQRNRAEKNGHPKQAVKDEKKVQKDNKTIKKDHKNLNTAKAAN